MNLEDNLTAGRHPAVVKLAGYFDARRTGERARPIAAEIEHTARTMLAAIPDSSELSVGLRKLLEARECFIRAAAEAEAAGGLRAPFPD